MASNGNSVDLVEVKEEPESLVRKCRAKSQEIFNLETNYRELQRTARELGIPSNLKVTYFLSFLFCGEGVGCLGLA